MQDVQRKVWSNFKEWMELLWINFVVLMRNLIEFFKVALRYYSNSNFLKTDLALRLMYLFHNPFSISKRFLMDRGEKDVYAYGETPLTTLERIARECHLSSKDVVYELGAGRGRTCFWLRAFIGCRVVGVEYIPEFVERANRIKTKLGLKGVEFCLQDMIDTDFRGATVIYLYGTCLEDNFIRKLAAKLARLPAGTKIITVSYPLTDYAERPLFEVMKRFPAAFTWGEADVYLQVTTGRKH
jgi:SAM-dependent methyltransferase